MIVILKGQKYVFTKEIARRILSQSNACPGCDICPFFERPFSCSLSGAFYNRDVEIAFMRKNAEFTLKEIELSQVELDY